MLNIGASIKKLREISGLSQKELALRMSVTPVFISYVEGGKRNVSQKLLAEFSSALDVPVEIILWDSVDMSDLQLNDSQRTLFKTGKALVSSYLNDSNSE